MNWFKVETEWNEDHDYKTPSIASPALQSWYNTMKEFFPPMSGIDAPTDEQLEGNENLEGRIADYCIGRDVIYVTFSWSCADAAYELVKKLARQHNVGFFDVSADKGDIILPEGSKII